MGDLLRAEPAEGLSLELEGPFAAALAAEADNLVLAAARRLRARRGARLVLQKGLPVASGIGGGSADAAAALRLLSRLWSVPLPDPAELAALGADLPACLRSRPARMRGIGEQLEPLRLPPFWLALVNPGRPIATAAVFARLARRDGAPLCEPPAFRDAAGLAEWLAAATRNDLEAVATGLDPAVAEALAALRAQPGCRLARMSGSGATCFGLFETAGAAEVAAKAIGRDRPGWWAASAACGPQGPLATA